MKHETFPQDAGLALRECLARRRREARAVALAAAAFALLLAIAAGLAAALEHCQGAAVLAMLAFGSLLIGTAAASEA